MNLDLSYKLVRNALHGYCYTALGMTPTIVKGYDSAQKQKHRITATGYNYGQIEEMNKWVSDTFGAKIHGWWNPRWSYAEYGIWHFKNEADASFFMLRWV